MQKFRVNPLPWAWESIIDTGARGVCDLFPCDMYILGAFQGIYHFGLSKDGKICMIDDNNPLHAYIEPVNWNTIWGQGAAGWAGIYPDVLPQGIIDNLQAFMDFAEKSSDTEFRNNAHNYIDIWEWIDYNMLQQAIMNWDGFNNNITMATYDGGIKWHPFAYDLNETFGGNQHFAPYGFPLITNVLNTAIPIFAKIERVFRNECIERFKFLYDNGVYTYETFEQLIDDATTYISTDSFKQNKTKWEQPYNSPTTGARMFWSQGMLDYYKKRLRYMKYYYNYRYTF
jgi:hypothetical protein